MSVIDIQHATETLNCRVEGCGFEARAARGPYAYLCDKHTAEKRDGAAGRLRVAKPVALNGASFEAKAKDLVAVGKKLDRATVAYKPAKEALEQAMQDWRDTLARLAGNGG